VAGTVSSVVFVKYIRASIGLAEATVAMEDKNNKDITR